MTTIISITATPRFYECDGWLFEVHYYSGPWPLRKDGELRRHAGRKFWKMWRRFNDLPKAEQEKYRVGGQAITGTINDRN